MKMSIADIFADAQKSSINHKSLTKRLRRIEAKHDDQRDQFDEQIKECVIRCLEVSKSERAGLNTVKFICSYCAATQVRPDEQDEEETLDDDSNNTTNQMIILLLPYMSVKDKIVRYRATQIVSQLMGIVQEIDDDLYQAIRHELGKRVRDKVPQIRLEAVCALGRLLENEMQEEAQAAQEKSHNDEDEDMLDDEYEIESADLLDKLLDVLQNDTNADVRRALLLNMPIDAKTTTYLLERARDKDASVRRALFIKLMPKMGDFRHLSLTLREKILRWGLRDKDEKVRKATVKMFSTLWIEQVAKSLYQGNEDNVEAQPRKKQVGFYEPNMTALEELIERLDTMDIGSEGGIGTEAMVEFWEYRPDYFDVVSFDDEFFHDLNVEKAFIARTFYEYCAQNPGKHLEAAEGQKFPEVTRFGYYLQHHLRLVTEMYASLAAEIEIDEDKLTEQEFICEQLLHIAHFLDYTDEIGRRKMFSLLRDTIAMSTLSDEITRLAIQALRLTCTADAKGEKEFIAVVQEAMVEVQDEVSDETEDNGTNREISPADDESFVSAHSELSQRSNETARPSQTTRKSNKNLTPEEAEDLHQRTLLVQLKCLNIAHSLLQNITSDFATNISLETMLNTLIIPAVQAREMILRERAIDCLGLACLLSQSLWRNNYELFMACMRRGHEELQERALKILCDCTIVHHGSTTSQVIGGQQTEENTIDLGAFTEAFEFSAPVQTCATTCIAKLMMAGFYKPKIKTTESDTGDDEAESGVLGTDPFEAAIEEAIQAGIKGGDLLAKVKAALTADATALQKTQAEQDKRMLG